MQVQLAEELGLDIQQFTADIESGKAKQLFQEDLQECRKKGVRGFPTFLVRSSEGEVLLRGHTSYQTFESWLQELSQDPLERKILTGGSPQVFDFISRYGKTAVMEIATVFDLSFKGAEVLLTGMAERGLIVAERAGNGFLYTLPEQVSQTCDPETGSCTL